MILDLFFWRSKVFDATSQRKAKPPPLLPNCRSLFERKKLESLILDQPFLRVDPCSSDGSGQGPACPMPSAALPAPPLIAVGHDRSAHLVGGLPIIGVGVPFNWRRRSAKAKADHYKRLLP